MWKRTEVIVSMVLVLIGIAVTAESFRLKIGTPLDPEPGFFTFISGGLLAALSVGFLISLWLESGKGPLPPEEPFGELARPLILLVAMGVYTAVLDSLGYILPTIVLSAVILRVLGVKSKRELCIASLLLAFITYYLFDKLLGIDLPPGVLPFLS